eukprot:TRINITY_DN3929_c0_g1_i2.p1 TRINITY_DN3929_c0_g1~~TRINITY_DN3929_c0_g1_i2.p1  ORF type:complete len:191 (+),score=4.97 TRINITY_DN3929_c0_g1_i2:35-607(+)
MSDTTAPKLPQAPRPQRRSKSVPPPTSSSSSQPEPPPPAAAAPPPPEVPAPPPKPRRSSSKPHFALPTESSSRKDVREPEAPCPEPALEPQSDMISQQPPCDPPREPSRAPTPQLSPHPSPRAPPLVPFSNPPPVDGSSSPSQRSRVPSTHGYSPRHTPSDHHHTADSWDRDSGTDWGDPNERSYSIDDG